MSNSVVLDEVGTDEGSSSTTIADLGLFTHHRKAASDIEMSFDELYSALDLDQQIELLTLYADETTLAGRDRYRFCLNLANVLSDRFDRDRGRQDLESAVIRGEEALALSSDDAESHFLILSDLSTIYLTRYELEGQEKDLLKALEYVSTSFDNTPRSSPSRLLRASNF